MLLLLGDDMHCSSRDNGMGERDARVDSEKTEIRPTVYVVDDDASTRRALTRLLLASGFNTVDFESAEAFLDSASLQSDACLLIDIHMPGMSGIELCQRLTASGWKLPIILMTAHSDPRTRLLAAKTNSIMTLYKPFDEEDLLAAISLAKSATA